jgi:UV DNA damage endonuclease
MNRIGYCCINLSINEDRRKKDYISVNRGMTKKTFEAKGLSYVSELAMKNIEDCIKIIEWNISNGIYVYRMSSDMFPCIGFYDIKDLPNLDDISEKMRSLGRIIKENGIRTTFHPSHFNVLASESASVVDKAIDELDKHAQLMDMMGLDQTPYYAINIHVNTTKPTREDAAARFVSAFDRLSDSCKKRLTVENDDSPNQYSVKILKEHVHDKIGIPIVFDQHHFNYGPKDQSMEEALKTACSTWGGIRPLTHMSSPKTIEDAAGKATAHADYIYEAIETFGMEFDTELECKKKDIALFKYRKYFF